MLTPLKSRDKLSPICHSLPAMSNTTPAPSKVSIDVSFDGGSFTRTATRLDDGDIEIVTLQGGFAETVLPAPVAFVFAQWEAYAIQRLAGNTGGGLPDLLTSAAAVSLASFHSER